MQVPWSLSIVITVQSLDRYNEIFRFLMQIKWAKWTLESCRVRGLSQPPLLMLHLHGCHVQPSVREAYCACLGWLCILVTHTQLLCLALYVLKVANMCDTGVSPSYIPPYLGPTACHLTGLSDGEQSLAHRMHLLKGRLLHFISSVESYLMTRVSGTDSQPRSDISTLPHTLLVAATHAVHL